MLESITNVAIGFVITLVCSPFIYTLCGMEYTWGQLGWVTVIFTLLSIIRSYIIRRFFNKKTIEEVNQAQSMKTKVYSAFPGVGKTTYFNTTNRIVLDSDSSTFDKKHFPDNYIEHIERAVQDPTVDKVLVSSHKDVRDALVKKGIPFVLVYPDRSLKDEYIQRYKDRGNNDAFVGLLEKNWDMWMDEMDAMGPQEGQSFYKVKLASGQYLTDVID